MQFAKTYVKFNIDKSYNIKRADIRLNRRARFILQKGFAFIKNKIEKNIYVFIFGCVFLILGIGLGITYVLKSYGYYGYYDNIYRIYGEWFSYYYSPFRLLVKRLFFNCIYIIIFMLLSTKKFLLPVSYFLLIYRGFVLGIGIIVFYNVYSISGIITIIVVLVPQSLAISLSCIITISSLFDCEIKDNLLTVGVYTYLICVAVAIYEFVVLTLFLRPTLFYF